MAKPADIPPPVLYVVAGQGRDRVVLGTADDLTVEVPRLFTAVYEMDDLGRVELDVEAEAGRVRVAELRLIASDDGLSGLKLGQVKVSQLLSTATERMAWMTGSRSGGQASYGGVRQVSGQASRRRRLTEDRLRAVAEAYRSGGIEAVMALPGEQVGERQAWRLRAEAVKRGLLSEEEG